MNDIKIGTRVTNELRPAETSKGNEASRESFEHTLQQASEQLRQAEAPVSPSQPNLEQARAMIHHLQQAGRNLNQLSLARQENPHPANRKE